MLSTDGKHRAGDCFLIDVAADHAIPFSKYASLLYCTWHLEIAAILMSYLYCDNLGGYWRLTVKLLLGLFAILFICLVFPNQVDLRPEVIEGDDIFAELTRMIYLIDNNHNVFPSGHALGAVLMAIGWGRISNSHWKKTAAWILNLGIIVSTFLLKQHSIIDAAGGIALAFFVDYTVEWMISIRTQQEYPMYEGGKCR